MCLLAAYALPSSAAHIDASAFVDAKLKGKTFYGAGVKSKLIKTTSAVPAALKWVGNDGCSCGCDDGPLRQRPH